MLWFRFYKMKEIAMFTKPVRFACLLMLAGWVASLPGCGNKESKEADEVEPAVSAAPALPKVNYWKLISPFVAGSYAAQCLPLPKPEPYADTLTIAADGRVTAAGFNEDLARATSIVLGRGTDKGITENVMTAELGEFHLNMIARSEDGAASWSARKNDKNAACEKSTDMPGLKGKKWITALAPTLSTLPRKITCIPNGEVKQEQVDFRVTDGTAMLNKDVFELKDAIMESVIFTDALAVLHYSATFADQRVLQLDYNSSGKLDKITGKGNNNQLYSCQTR